MRNPVYRAPKPKTPQHLMPGTALTGQGPKSAASTGPPGAGAKQIPIKEVLGDALRCLEQEGVEAVCGYLEKLAGAQGRTAVAMPQRLTTLASLVQQKDPKSALLLAQKAIGMDEENMAAWMLAGSLQDRLGDRKASAQAMRRVVRSPLTKPDQVVRAANLLVRFGDQQEALDSAKAAFDKLGRPIHLASALMYIARLTADWVRVDELKAQMSQAYAKGQCAEVGESPRTHLLWCGDEATNIKVVKNWSERSIRLPQQVNAPKPEPLEGRRIRVGYLSSDFRDHPTSRLINGLFRHHDRSKFELFMYCSSWDDKSEMRSEIESHFDHRHAVAHLSDEAAAQLIRSHGIDVLVELNGPTRAHRMGILAHRPAPVQMDYLGWPGSVGGRVVDYIIGDDYTVPPEMEELYPEKVIKLSKTYQINDFASRTLPGKPTKQAVGLPEGEHLILGMFNAINKVDGSVWDAWMRIMRSVPNSLLWMLDPGPVARQLIAQATQKSGVEAKRIVIAPRLKQEAHLSRMQCCDLMLDPWPYGGHTSTSDALFARVPVIALQGTNFASRVSGGLLRAAGMGVMVQPDVDSYVSKAIELLSKPVMLEQAKRYLRERVPKSDLFDAVGKARKLEDYYKKSLDTLSSIEEITKINKKTVLIGVEGSVESLVGAKDLLNKSIEVCIISWTGMHENAMKIYDQLKEEADEIKIIYSDKDSNCSVPDRYECIKTNNNLFWGDKFNKCIERFNSDVLLIIHADCTTKDWRLIVRKCKEAYLKNNQIGIWAPKTNGTAFPLEITTLLDEKINNLNLVTYIDGIVFALNSEVVKRMKLLDYSKNKYGWGIDWFAAAFAYSVGMVSLVDEAVIVDHPPSRGYTGYDALKQMDIFMRQLSVKERIYYNLIRLSTKYLRAIKNMK